MRRAPPWAGARAARGLAMLVGTGLVAAACMGKGAPISLQPSTTLSAAPLPTAFESHPARGFVPGDSQGGEELGWFDGRLVLVGAHTPPLYATEARIWLSDDGVRWRRAPATRIGTSSARAVVVNRGELVVGGYEDLGDARSASPVWISRDGTTWDSLRAPGDEITEFLAARDGVLAVCGAQELCASRDARRWSRVPLPEGMDFVTDVTALGESFVLIGWMEVGRDPDNAAGRPVVSTSRDGRSWGRARAVTFSTNDWEEASVLGVASSGSSIVVLGNLLVSGGGDNFTLNDVDEEVLWHSVDGLKWRETLRVPSWLTLTDIAVSENGFVVVGNVPVNPSDPADFRSIPTAWTSPDGVTWAQITLGPEGTAVGSVVATPDRFVAIGLRGTPTVWLANPTREPSSGLSR